MTPGIQGGFDARTVAPEQGRPKHPAGLFDFQITDTEIKPTKDDSGGMLVVEFTSPAGTIENRYNLFNNSPQAVEIARKNLSALCHAVGVFNLDFSNEAAALRGARGRMEVGPQVKNPEFNEVKRVFDSQGNEPGKAPAAQGNFGGGQQQQPMQQPQGQPMQQQPGGGWGTQQQPNPNPQPQPQGQQGWPQQNQQQPAPQQQQQPQPNQWQPGNAAPQGNQPPWAKG